MPFCPAGESPEPKPGYGQAVSMSIGAIGGLFEDVGLPWAVGLGALIGALQYDLSSLCNADPPTPPTITADDVTALIAGPLIATPDYFAALNKMHDLVRAYAWFQFCQCTGGTTPAAPSPQAEPTDMPTLVSAPLANGPCHTDIPLDSPKQYSSASVVSASSRSNVPSASATSVKITFTQTASTGGGFGLVLTFFVTASSVSNTPIGAQVIMTVPNGGSASVALDIPFGGNVIKIAHANQGGSATVTMAEQYDYYCGAALGSTANCCHDDAVEAQLNQVLSIVTLIQRQIAPFAFTDGDSDSALVDSGEIVVTTPLVGIRFEATTLPSRIGLAVGDPDLRYNVGRIALGDADGWFGWRDLDTDALTWQPRWAGAVTRIGYYLTPGVVGTITQLEREP